MKLAIPNFTCDDIRFIMLSAQNMYMVTDGFTILHARRQLCCTSKGTFNDSGKVICLVVKWFKSTFMPSTIFEHITSLDFTNVTFNLNQSILPSAQSIPKHLEDFQNLLSLIGSLQKITLITVNVNIYMETDNPYSKIFNTIL